MGFQLIPPSRLLWLLVLAVVLTMTVAPRDVRAQPENRRAYTLFQDAVALEKGKEYKRAIAKLEASMALKPTPQTVSLLARCHLQLGHTATAWYQYLKSAQMAAREADRRNDPRYRDYADAATAEAKALEPLLARLLIQASPNSEATGLHITCQHSDEREPSTFPLNNASPVDPGTHTIRVTADGYRPFETVVEARAGREVVVALPLLEPQPIASEPATNKAEPVASEPMTTDVEPIADSAQPVRETADAKRSPHDSDNPTRALQPGRTRRVLGIAGVAVGTAALGIGLGLGWSATSQHDRAFDDGLCDRATLRCTLPGQMAVDSARRRAHWSTAVTATGVAMIGVGLAVYLTAPKRRKSARAALVPLLAPSAFGLALGGRL